jgi:hypothetical protein
MQIEEKAAFWERLSELGFIIYNCENNSIIVDKCATPLNDSVFEEEYPTKNDAIEAVKELIGWTWENTIKEEEAETRQLIKVEVSVSYKVPVGMNNYVLGTIEHFDEDEITKEAEKRAKLYFKKNYPLYELDIIKWKLNYKRIA